MHDPLTGTTLGPYEIAGLLGAGGMGEVYRARDPRLGRDVAIKILPRGQTVDSEQARRFLQEARSASALNHPNIVSIFDIGQHDGVTYLVMELVEGQPLSAVIPSAGLPLAQALRYASQVASALAAAHKAGLVHRDVKPANIMLADGGSVKVLDFGLAKLTGRDAVTDAGVTGALVTGTVPGSILGTIGYMSPEQAQGKPVDARSDVFAFGAVLYEMITGRKAFARDSAISTLAAILKDEPTPAREIAPGLPPALERVIARCLRKDVDVRFQHMDDVALLLQDVLDDLARPSEGAAVAARTAAPARGSWIVPAGMALGGLVLGALGAWLVVGSEAPAPQGVVRRFEIPIQARQSELSLGQALPGPVLSPDGRAVAYVENGILRVRAFDNPRPRDLASGVEGPFWSPDSREIAYLSEGMLRRVPASGGSPVTICQANLAGKLLGGSWSDDGRILVSFSGSNIYEVPAEGGSLKPLVTPDRARNEFDFHEPVFLPGGKSILAALHQVRGDIMRLTVITGGERMFVLGEDAGDIRTPVYSPGGRIVYTRKQNMQSLYSVPFSLASLATTGPPVHLVDDATAPSVSADHTLAYRSGTWAMPADMVMLDRSGRVIGPASKPYADIRDPALSPDGERVAFNAWEAASGDLWVRDLVRGTEVRIAGSIEDEGQPAWSPDGSEIVFTSGTFLENKLLVARADGSSSPRTLAECAQPCRFPHMSGDGRLVAWTSQGDIHWLRLDGQSKPVRIQTQEAEQAAQLSPDGRHYVYAADASGRTEIYVRSFPSGDGRWQVSTDGGHSPVWDGSSSQIYFTRDNVLYSVSVETRGAFKAEPPATLLDGDEKGVQFFRFMPGVSGFDVAPGGQRFVAVRQAGASGNFITVVENWLLDSFTPR